MLNLLQGLQSRFVVGGRFLSRVWALTGTVIKRAFEEQRLRSWQYSKKLQHWKSSCSMG